MTDEAYLTFLGLVFLPVFIPVFIRVCSAKGEVDLSKYYQKSWTGAPFTNQEWVQEVGKGHSYADGVDGNNPEGNVLHHPRA